MHRPRFFGLTLTIVFLCLTAGLVAFTGLFTGRHFQVKAAQDRVTTTRPDPLPDFDIRAGRARALSAEPVSVSRRRLAAQRANMGRLEQTNPRSVVRWSSVSGSASRV